MLIQDIVGIMQNDRESVKYMVLVIILYCV
jgi:hypothetical protein